MEPATYRLLTALQTGAVGVIELRNAEALLPHCLRNMQSDATPKLPPNRPVHCRLIDGDETLDDIVATHIPDCDGTRWELCLHGGVRVMQRAMMMFERIGAQRREHAAVDVAADSRGLSDTELIEAEVDRLLLPAPTRRVATWLLHQRQSLPAWVDRLRGGDVSAEERQAMRLAGAAAQKQFAGQRVAIVGAPNVGKSTLANALIGRDAAITADLPGTTRDWVEETANICGWPVTLTDTAGIRQTDDAIERLSIERGLERAATAALTLVVIDATRGESQREMWAPHSTASHSDAARIAVFNKIDLAGDFAVPQAKPPWHDVCGVSAARGTGLEALERQIAAALGLDLLDDALPTIMTRLLWHRFEPLL